jgi:hypothetical protein
MLKYLISLFRPISSKRVDLRKKTFDLLVRDKCWRMIDSSETMAHFVCCEKYLGLALDGGHISMHVWVESNYEMNKKSRALCPA